MGDFSQKSLFPAGPRVKAPLDPASPLVDAAERFATRARCAGFPHMDSLWPEARSQVERGWLTDPSPLGDSGGLTSVSAGSGNVAFRVASIQMDKIRACDDFKYGRVNLACAVRTPIKFPTWGHIGQMCLDVDGSDMDWSFFKADREAAYKNIPLSLGQASSCNVAMRCQSGGKWYCFLPRAVLFGDASAVLRYNCFSRIVAVSANRICGLPLVNYFDDFGCLVADFSPKPAVKVFTSFCKLLGIRLNRKKTEVGRRITFLDMEGFPPGRDNGMKLSIDLAASKKQKWDKRISEFLAAWSISHKELGSLAGRLSFSQTAICGRFGRALMQPLYRKANAPYYQCALSGEDVKVRQWWEGMLLAAPPRTVQRRNTAPGRIIYTDAATSTLISAIIAIFPLDCTVSPVLEAWLEMIADQGWVGLFVKTNLIYGLEMLAIVQTAAGPALDLDGRCVTFYIDSNNAICALISGRSRTVVISVLVRTFWAICGRRGDYSLDGTRTIGL